VPAHCTFSIQTKEKRFDMTSTVQSQNDQVALFELLFAMSWEDPEADRAALTIQSEKPS
jgi:hypothetical protein